MDYQKIYDDLISRAKSENRKKGEGVYYEAHHILPRCLGGKGNVSCYKTHPNLVLLTAREHYLAHKLLVFIYPNNKSLKDAYWAFVSFKNKEREGLISMKEYEELRIYHAKRQSERATGKKASDETKQKLKDQRNTTEWIQMIRDRATGKKASDETKQKMSISRTGQKRTQKTKDNISKSLKGKEKSKEARDNMSKSASKRKGETQNNVKLKEHQVLEMRELYIQGVSISKLASDFGVCWGHVKRIIDRVAWAHI